MQGAVDRTAVGDLQQSLTLSLGQVALQGYAFADAVHIAVFRFAGFAVAAVDAVVLKGDRNSGQW